jgi:hypothetical protein
MNGHEPVSSPPQPTRGSAFAAVALPLARLFPWHAAGFLAANAVITAINVFTGPPWWGLWPLLATGALLGAHYLVYKATAVDERWVDARVEELNLKSYDRSHIEGLKGRHGSEAHER